MTPEEIAAIKDAVATLSVADHLGDARDAEATLLGLLGLSTEWDDEGERFEGSAVVLRELYGDVYGDDEG